MISNERDVPLILDFIRKLAEYEKLSHLVVASESDIHKNVFGPNPVAEVLLAYWDGEPVGFALYLRNFSTFLGQAGIYLEDLFVEPAHRGRNGRGRRRLGRRWRRWVRGGGAVINVDPVPAGRRRP